jgi:DNA-binding transcriptional LysR family regulator
MDRLDAMATLVQVVASGSFAAAGRRLGLPRSAISKRVSLLEAHFGARLFHRTTRKLSLTDAGARLHEHCQTILDAVARAEHELDDEHGSARGVLRMSAPREFTLLHLSTHLEQFIALYPAVSLDLELSERFVDLVEERFDLALRITTSPPEGLIAKKLAPSSVVICGSPAYLRRQGRPAQPGDLVRHSCLGYKYQAQAATWELGGPRPLRVNVAVKHRTNDNRLLRQLALDGHGLAQLPSYLVADDLAAGRLITILDRYRDVSRSIYVVYPSRARLPPNVRTMVNHLSAALRGESRWA